MKENWRDIPGYEGLYQISIDTKEGRCRRFYKNGKVKELSNNPKKENRIYWCLCKNSEKNDNQAAVWIALTYPELIENEYFDGAEIDHKDGDKMNNSPLNLHWVSRAGNMNNPITKKQIANTELNRSDLSLRVLQYTLDGEYVNDYPSTQEAARKNPGYSQGCIAAVARGERETHKGYKWKYLITK